MKFELFRQSMVRLYGQTQFDELGFSKNLVQRPVVFHVFVKGELGVEHFFLQRVRPPQTLGDGFFQFFSEGFRQQQKHFFFAVEVAIKSAVSYGRAAANLRDGRPVVSPFFKRFTGDAQ